MVAASTDSPRTMSVNSPKRSAMWCGCQVVTPVRSAQMGTDSSATAITGTPSHRQPSGTTSSSAQPAMQAETPAA
jgi:hypothetical protein